MGCHPHLAFVLAGVNVTMPSQPGVPPLSSTQLQIDPTLQEFQLVDLSRRFLVHDAFWALPKQFLGNKVGGRVLLSPAHPKAAPPPTLRHPEAALSPLLFQSSLGSSLSTVLWAG